MGYYERALVGDVDDFIQHLDARIIGGSVSASLEARGDQRLGDARMVTRGYERYSAMGGNRVALTVSVLEVSGQLAVSAISSGGSQALFFKINTLGESAFLDKARVAIDSYPQPAP